MKHTLILALLSSSLLSYDIRVNVSNLSKDKGDILFAIYNKGDVFLKRGKEYKKAKVDKDKKTSYTFKNVPKGTYAIAVVDDKNRNQKMDRNIFGIPKEGYGLSNNIRPHFKPSFDDCKFKLNKNLTLNIKMGY